MSLMLGGCTLASKYHRPDYPLPETYRGVETATESFGDVEWWEVFQDPQLQELIRKGLENNYDLRIATARVVEARAGLTAARAGLFPALTASGRASRSDTYQIGSTELTQEPGWRVAREDGRFKLVRTPGGPDNEAERDSANAALDLSWEVDLWGRVRSASEAARADFVATEAGRAAVVQSLVTGIAEAYLALRTHDLELDIARKTLDSRKASLRLVELRKEGGVASRLEVRQAEVLVATAEASIPNIERQIAQTENLLSTLIGENPQDIARGKSLPEQDIAVEVPAGLPSDLLERRPDIRAAEQALVAANARVGEARAAYFPRITLTGAAGIVSPALAGVFEGPAGTTAVGPAATWTLFNAGKVRAGVKAAKARREQAMLTYEQTVQQALRDVADALVGATKARELRERQEVLVTALDDATQLATKRYQGGVSSYLEVLDAERQRFDAELGLAQARLDVSLNIVKLYKALGGGWEKTAP
jgi:multidrug efflux system outer membrane protein